jgi:hypothetical protein
LAMMDKALWWHCHQRHSGVSGEGRYGACIVHAHASTFGGGGCKDHNTPLGVEFGNSGQSLVVALRGGQEGVCFERVRVKH